MTEGFYCTYLKKYENLKKKFYDIYTMLAKKPLNLGCAAADRTITVILAANKKMFSIMNKSNGIRIRFQKY